MHDPSKPSYQELLEEISGLKQKIEQFERLETKRKQSEGVLQESTERYRSLVDNIDFGINLIDKNFTVIATNAAFEKLLRKPTSEIVGKKCFKEFEKRQEVCKHCPGVLAMATGQTHQVETKGIRDDGSSFIARIYAHPLIYPDGTIGGFNEVVEDITERKQSEIIIMAQRDLSFALAEGKTLQDALHICLENAITLTEFDVGSIFEIDPVTGHSRLACIIGFSDFHTKLAKQDHVSQLRHELIMQGIPYYIEAEEIRTLPFREALLEEDIKSIAFIPIKMEAKIIGGLIVASHVADRIAPYVRRALEAIANQIGIAISKAKSDEALRESEEKYRLTFSSVSDVIYTIDSDLRISSITPNVEKFLGYKADDLINRPFQDLTFLTPESLEKAASDITRVIVGEPISASVYEFVAKDGKKVFGEISGSPMIHEGKISGVSAVARDITERKRMEDALRESEQRYRIMTENATDIIWTMDLNLRFTFVSPSIERQQGWTVEEAISLSLQDVVTPNSLKMAMKVFEEELANEQLLNKDPKRTRTLEIEQYRKDGAIIWLEMTASFLRDKEGNAIGIMGISREISERKKLETQLRQAQKMQAIGTLAGGIAHDFNNILGAIMGYTDLALSNNEMDSQIRRYLERVYQAGERARDLVKQILTFSHQTEQERTPVQIAVIVKEVLKLLRSSLPTTIEIQQDIITPPGRDVVLADPTQIHQVLMNLCTNAAHAMRAKGGILGVSIWDIDADAAFVEQYPDMEPGPYIKLTVSDTGHGMDAAVKERIFEPYFTTKGVGEGTGLGLAVVQGIVKSYGGAIFVTSEPYKGSIFHIFLHRYEGESPSRVEEEEAPPAKNERVLFVDDEGTLVDLGKEILASLDYHVTATTSSLEALEIFRNTPEAFDLVFTDMTMPKMTGIELAQECMKLRPDIPVILGSGFSDMIDEKQAKELGIRAYVMKPYVITSIAKAIRAVLEEQK